MATIKRVLLLQRSLAANCRVASRHCSTTSSHVTSCQLKSKRSEFFNSKRCSFYSPLSDVRSFHTTNSITGKVVPFLLSDIGEGIREVVVKEWFISEGEHVNQFDPICEVQSDKASVTITSRYDGVVTKRYHKLDDTALVGDPLVDIELGDGAHDSVAADQVDDVTGSSVAAELESELAEGAQTGLGGAAVADAPTRTTGSKALATPAVRRIAAENKIQLHDVVGTGKDGRVMKEDVLSYITNTLGGKLPAATKATPVKSATPAPQPSAPAQAQAPMGEDTMVTLKGIRKAMSKSMSEALSIPHFGYYDEVDMSALVKLRRELKGSAILGTVPFSYMPVIIKAASLSLKQFPILNSSYISEDQLLLKAAHNIGFAMDSPEGLVVPNIKNVQNLTVLEIAAEMQRLMALGEQSKLGQNDIIGGTFSLSNIGSIGGTYAKPVILPPQAAIGALGKIQALPRFAPDDTVIKAHIMAVSWSADHRIIEGAQMARFSNLWKSYLENPASLILNMK